MRISVFIRRGVLGFAVVAAGALPQSFAADKPLDLDALSGNGAESLASLNVVTTSPVKVKNKITNKAIGQSFRFSWLDAGPGGFASSVAAGTSTGVGTIWTWETLQQVYAVTGNATFTQVATGTTRTLTGLPGRSLSSSGARSTSASLTSSLITFASPPEELVRLTSRVEQIGFGLNRYIYEITNFTGDDLTYNWTPGPIECNTGFCGNDIVQSGEVCDGSDLAGMTCIDLGYDGGTLGCTTDCEFDTSNCTSTEPYCGDGVVNNKGEFCDGSDLNGNDCDSVGCFGGVLGCTTDCLFDISGCSCIGLNGAGQGAAQPVGEPTIPCEFPGFEGKMDPDSTKQLQCRLSPHPSKEVSSQATVCNSEIPEGPPGCGSGLGTQGTANVLVPDEDIVIANIFLSPILVEVDDGSDGRAEPGETVRLYISLLNAGSKALTGVTAHLVADPADLDDDGGIDDVATVLQANSAYPDLPAAPEVTGDCDTILGALDPKKNLTAFVVQYPSVPSDVGYQFHLVVDGVPTLSGTTSVIVPLVTGVGSACDPSLLTGDFDRLNGLLSPMGPLVPAENDTPLPTTLSTLSTTRPLKLKMYCGGKLLSGKDGIQAPEIVRLTRDGVDVDLTKLYLDVNSNANDHSLLFRFSGGSSAWIYNLNTSAIGPGDYVVYIMMPNGQVYKSAFTI